MTSPARTTGSCSARPRPRPEGQFATAAAALERLLQDGHFGGPGSILNLSDLARLTGHTAAATAYAVQQLVSAGAVERSKSDNSWRIPDDRSRERCVRRVRTLLEAMIENGGYPPGRTLPSVRALSFTLLTAPPAVNAALDKLAYRTILQPTGRRFTVTVRPQSPDATDPFDVTGLTGGRRRFPEVTTVPARFTVQHLRDTARAQWEDAQPLSPTGLHQRETLQRDLLRRLVLSARSHLAAHHRDGPPVRAACARAVAVAACPMATLGERHWRYAVLATLLADLADTLPR
ncbi:hypothetical protein [Streptomyces anthocyanicus]|uniref:hypothetical protein n=1 Tax=Streptomyces anthocyanicus TaxID=68174 RepID=UPI003800122B